LRENLEYTRETWVFATPKAAFPKFYDGLPSRPASKAEKFPAPGFSLFA
jgi:hypothetical protein